MRANHISLAVVQEDQFLVSIQEDLMWRAVLAQAIHDLKVVTQPKPKEPVTAQKIKNAIQAKDWLLKPLPKGCTIYNAPRGSVYWVCEFTDYCIVRLHKSLKQDLSVDLREIQILHSRNSLSSIDGRRR